MDHSQQTHPSPPGTLQRYGSIAMALWRNSIVREMQFRMNFLLWIVVELCWFGLQLGFIAVIYQHTDQIMEWTRWQVIFLVGAAQFIQQVFTAMFLSNITQISELVRTGRLDFMLLMPVNTRFLLSFRQVDLGGFVNAASAVAVMIYATRQLEMSPSPIQVLGFLALCLVGVWIHCSLMFLLSIISFWTVRAEGIVWGYYNLFNLARVPDSAFRGTFRFFFSMILPVLLVANVPVRLMIGLLESPWQIVRLLVTAAACFVVSEAVWRKALRRYTSASS